MKKESIVGFVIWAVLFLVAAVIGFIFLREYSGRSGLTQWQFIGFFSLAIIGGLVFNSILFELSHVIGALLGGYKVVSCCILGLKFYSKEGKFRIGFGKYDGLSGETKILPRELKKNRKNNPVLYCVMGTILFGIEFIFVLFQFFMYKDAWNADPVRKDLSNMAYFLLVFAVVGLIILLYNIIPFKLDSMTDGYRLRLISNKANKEAYNDYLYAVSGMSNEAKEEIKSQKQEKEKMVESAFSDDIKLNEVYKFLEKDDYEGALNIIDEILSDIQNKTGAVVLRAKAQKAFIIVLKDNIEDAQKWYDDNMSGLERKQLSEDVNLTSIRAYVLLSGILDKSQSECVYVLNKAYKAYKRTPDALKSVEVKLYNKAIDSVLRAHPAWELSQFKMFEN